MIRKSGAQTLAADVYDRLRTAILEGKFQSGERLLPADLASEYGVSAGVVREVLMRLTEQQLAVASPNRGFNIVHLDVADMHELVEFRLINEVAALRLSVERGDVTWEGSVLAAHHTLNATPVDPVGEWHSVHRAFHLALLSACGNLRLLRECKSLLEGAEMYLRWSRQVATGRAQGAVFLNRDFAGEHTAIMEAALARDAELAAALYRAHLMKTENLVEPSAREAERELRESANSSSPKNNKLIL